MSVSLERLAKWDAWANRQVLETLQAASGQPRGALAAFQHVLAAELTWFERMGGHEVALLPLWAEPSLETCAEWYDRSRVHFARLSDLLANGDYANQTFPYQNSSGKSFTGRVDEVLTHVFMHSSQYRGEAAGLLNNTGHRVPDLDLIFWIRDGEPA